MRLVRIEKIIFFFTAFSRYAAMAPLDILALSDPLLNAGGQVRTIDSTITPDSRKRVIEELEAC